ncbi:MAG: RNA 2',3'-cyclic phosphodiesterase [Alphaproteobacteria bacterium]|nr:RNA 2',3'-cyclic phosphodiesterase [Alphaproteobacteria bacterium]
MIRLFVGIDLPENVKKELQSLQKGLPAALWRPDKKMHLTLRFIGNLEEPVAEEVLKELRYIRFPAFHFALKGIGYFERGGIPHHIWAGVDKDKALRELQQKIDSAVKKAGAGQADKFKFVPHVTLGKLFGATRQDVFEYIGRNNLFHTPEFEATSFILYQSIARENGEGKYYKEIEEFPLMLV